MTKTEMSSPEPSLLLGRRQPRSRGMPRAPRTRAWARAVYLPGAHVHIHVPTRIREDRDRPTCGSPGFVPLFVPSFTSAAPQHLARQPPTCWDHWAHRPTAPCPQWRLPHSHQSHPTSHPFPGLTHHLDSAHTASSHTLVPGGRGGGRKCVRCEDCQTGRPETKRALGKMPA